MCSGGVKVKILRSELGGEERERKDKEEVTGQYSNDLEEDGTENGKEWSIM